MIRIPGKRGEEKQIKDVKMLAILLRLEKRHMLTR